MKKLIAATLTIGFLSTAALAGDPPAKKEAPAKKEEKPAMDAPKADAPKMDDKTATTDTKDAKKPAKKTPVKKDTKATAAKPVEGK